MKVRTVSKGARKRVSVSRPPALTNPRCQPVALSSMDIKQDDNQLQQQHHLRVSALSVVHGFNACRYEWCSRRRPPIYSPQRRAGGVGVTGWSDREWRRADGCLTQNLSRWDYQIGLNHWFIAELHSDSFSIGSWMCSNMASQTSLCFFKTANQWCHPADAEKYAW